MDSELITPAQLAEEAGVRRQMIFNYLAAGRIKGIRSREHDGRWMITRTDADVWLESRRLKAQAKYEEIQRQLRGET